MNTATQTTDIAARYAQAMAFYGSTEETEADVVIRGLGLSRFDYLRLRRHDLGLPRISRGDMNRAYDAHEAATARTETRRAAQRDLHRSVIAQGAANAR